MRQRTIIQPIGKSKFDFEKIVSDTINGKKSKIVMRSPLRYPGGKSRAFHTIYPYLPSGLKTMCSPFLGGASFEIACASKGIKVYGSDAFHALINFWEHAKNEPVLLSIAVGKYYPLSKIKFYHIQKTYNKLSTDIEKAAVFFVLNRSSYSGVTFSGGMSCNHPRFTETSIKRLRDFKVNKLDIKYKDYREALKTHKNRFLYLDPPYANGEKLYGNSGDMHTYFNHEELSDILHNRDGWVLSYNDCPKIRKLYKDYKTIKPQWVYGMAKEKQSNELLIINV